MKIHSVQNYDIQIKHASICFLNNGQKKIFIDVKYRDKLEPFFTITSNHKAIDNVRSLNGNERYDALYKIIDKQIEGEILEWISELDN